jgi:hypothetical protein
MSVQSKPYFWVECDGDECDAKAPDGDEYSAFEEANQAIEYAEDSDWVITAAGESYCEDCAAQDDKDSAHLVSTVRGDPLPGLAP